MFSLGKLFSMHVWPLRPNSPRLRPFTGGEIGVTV